MTEVDEQLTYEEWMTVISRFKSSIIKLKKSGDYPEKQKDAKIINKMINLQFNSSTMRLERKGE